MSERDDGGFDWGSPRWREPDEAQADVERDRRFRDPRVPSQAGAIDGGESVPGQEPEASEAPRQPGSEGSPTPTRRRTPRKRRGRREADGPGSSGQG